MGSARAILDNAERLLGIRVFRAESGPLWPQAQFQRDLFDYLKPDCVLDVGANTGQYAMSLRKVTRFQGTIVSFEPNPVAFEELELNARQDPNWHCYPYALGAEEANVQLNIMQDDSFSSMRKPSVVSEVHFPGENKVASTISVTSKRLDLYLPKLQAEHGFSNPFLKMDTQGFDLEVVNGATDSLQQFCGLLSEVPIQQLYDGMPSIAEALVTYRTSGFEPVELFNVHAGLRFTPLLECDCYCVRKDLLKRF